MFNNDFGSTALATVFFTKSRLIFFELKKSPIPKEGDLPACAGRPFFLFFSEENDFFRLLKLIGITNNLFIS
jgi:hypothetical protein